MLHLQQNQEKNNNSKEQQEKTFNELKKAAETMMHLRKAQSITFDFPADLNQVEREISKAKDMLISSFVDMIWTAKEKNRINQEQFETLRILFLNY